MTGIYGFCNKENGKWYVGQAVKIQKRINTHLWMLRHGKHRNELMQKDWLMFGEKAFFWKVLEECDEEQLDEKEVYWIAQKKSFESGYNQTIGGYGQPGRVMPEKEKQWRHDRFLGEGNPMYGKKHTEETRRKLRESHKGERHVNYGKHLREETRRKISEAHKGMYHSEATKKKLSDMNKGKPPSRAAVEKSAAFTKSPENPQCRAVVCIDTGIEYYSTAEAARQTGLSRTKITACCVGRRKSTGGFHWKYKKN